MRQVGRGTGGIQCSTVNVADRGTSGPEACAHLVCACQIWQRRIPGKVLQRRPAPRTTCPAILVALCAKAEAAQQGFGGAARSAHGEKRRHISRSPSEAW